MESIGGRGQWLEAMLLVSVHFRKTLPWTASNMVWISAQVFVWASNGSSILFDFDKNL
jgi:hypothetical protein